jgi:hypothetical protein
MVGMVLTFLKVLAFVSFQISQVTSMRREAITFSRHEQRPWRSTNAPHYQTHSKKREGGVVDVKPILNYIQNVNIEAVFELKMGQRFVMATTLEQTLP